MKYFIPLNFYDQHGRVKPHWLIWSTVLFLLRAYIVLIVVSLSFGQDSSTLLAVFYPHSSDFYQVLLLGIPAWGIAVILSFREMISKKGYTWLFGYIKPLLLIGLCLDIALNINMAIDQQWRFSWSIALSFLFAGLAGFYCAKSRLLNAFIAEWKEVESESKLNQS